MNFADYQKGTRTTAVYSSPESEKQHQERLWHLGDRRIMHALREAVHAGTTADQYKKWIRDGKIPENIVAANEGAPKTQFDLTVQQVYVILGLISEVGELAELFLESIEQGKPPDFPKRLKKEAGDNLWYLSEICTEHGMDMGDVAQTNLDKLADRKVRSKIHGSGDER